MSEPISDLDLSTIRELATHAADIKHLQDDMDRVVSDINTIKTSLVEIQKTLSEAKGGWRVLMLIGGGCSLIGAGVMHVIQIFWHR